MEKDEKFFRDDLKESYRIYTNEQLNNILNAPEGEYLDLAVEVAKEEMEKRKSEGIDEVEEEEIPSPKLSNDQKRKEIAFDCPRCFTRIILFYENYKEKVLDPLTETCPKCSSKIEIWDLLHKQSQAQIQGSNIEAWQRYRLPILLDISPLTEQVNDKIEAMREEKIVCPSCHDQLTVRFQPEYTLSEKARLKKMRSGWRWIYGPIIFSLLIWIVKIFEESFKFRDALLLSLFMIGVGLIVGLVSLKDSKPGKIFPAGFSQCVSEGHRLIRPGEEFGAEQSIQEKFSLKRILGAFSREKWQLELTVDYAEFQSLEKERFKKFQIPRDNARRIFKFGSMATFSLKFKFEDIEYKFELTAEDHFTISKWVLL